MHFGNVRVYSVKIGIKKKVSDAFQKTPGAFRQRPLNECTRRFPEGIRNVF